MIIDKLNINGIRFVNPSGRVRTFPDATFEDWQGHISWLWGLRRRGEMWNHWPSVLVAHDPSAALPDACLATFVVEDKST